MSSPFRIKPLVAAAGLLLLAAGCRNTAHQPGPAVAPGESSVVPVPTSALIPGGGAAPTQPDPRAAPYYNNAVAVQRGMQLFKQFNCSGCHFNGGGGMGPPLMDDQWIYGGRLDQIYNTLVQGRPNGMPAWGGKIPDQQLWQIAAYVRSMSLPATLAANTVGQAPSQHPAPVSPQADGFDGWNMAAIGQSQGGGTGGVR